MIINSSDLLEAAPIYDMEAGKRQGHGTTFGLGEAGYDIRIKQDVVFAPCKAGTMTIALDDKRAGIGRFTLASAIEHFKMPENMVGVVHDKSTWARRGLSVFNTVIEPGFKGGLTLELVYHGSDFLRIRAGSGIAQVIFSQLTKPAAYRGKYQNQSTDPVPAIFQD